MISIQDDAKRSGYTTGTCAAAAAKAAAYILLRSAEGNISEDGCSCFAGHDKDHEALDCVKVLLPDGHEAFLEIAFIKREERSVTCGVIKDAGDDPDITDGMMILAEVSISEVPGISIDGGAGVGRVTKPGLDQPVGSAAINSVPRRMIRQAVEDILKTKPLTRGGISVMISIPGGEEKALHTMNPDLGIEGGLSVLGTSGIVEPMSERALLETIRINIRQRLAMGDEVLVMVPGNYGINYLTENYHADKDRIVKISNYIGESLDMASSMGAGRILLAGHIGKLVKVAGGIMNTHSSYADSRMEIMTAHAALCGAEGETLKEIMKCVTTDSAIDVLKKTDLTAPVMSSIISKAEYYLRKRAGSYAEVGLLMFSNVHGILGISETGSMLLESISRTDR